MCIVINGYQKIQILAVFRFTAFPTPGNLLFLAACTDLTKRGTATVTASIITSEFFYLPEKLKKRLIVRKRFCKRLGLLLQR